MYHCNLPSLLILSLSVSLVCGALNRTRHEIERDIDALLERMTLEEKLGQLQQLGNVMAMFSNSEPDNPAGDPLAEHLQLIRQGVVGSILYVRGAKRANDIQRAAMESRLQIPVLIGFDVIHGYRTLFPIPLGEAASWDLDAVQRAAGIAAVEARSAGIHWTFAPMMDVTRDPRWGRVMEGAGEDVFLVAEMSKAKIRGFQGTDFSQKDKVMACAKHFVGYGAVEAGRDFNSVDISERQLREVYLPPFQAAVEAGVGSVMMGYHNLNGVPVTGNHWLIRQVLRKEWQFDGLVVSDYESVQDLIGHGMAVNHSEAAMYALNAGTDMEMVSRSYVAHGAKLVEEGKVTVETVNTAVRNVLRTKFRLGLFEQPFQFVDEELAAKTLAKPEHLQAARELAAKSFVLLKNERNILPIDIRNVKELVVIGALADDKANTIDSWGVEGRMEDSVTVLEGIRERLRNTSVTVKFFKACDAVCNSSKNPDEFQQALNAAGTSDFVVAVVGETVGVSGEGASLTNLNLSGDQLKLLQGIAESGTPFVVVLKNGRPLTIEWLADYAPAILVTWHSGTMGGPAVADVLFGDVNPSGKLPMTFPRSVGQVPLYYDQKNIWRPYVAGNIFTEKYKDSSILPLYPFGFGLSYTSFSITNLRLNSTYVMAGDSVTVSVDLTNTGNRDGEEVVQLYLRDVAARITRSVRQLKAFRKVAVKVGERKRVDFTLTERDMGFLDEAWRMTVEPGEFVVFVGNSSDAELSRTFTLFPSLFSSTGVFVAGTTTAWLLSFAVLLSNNLKT
ncbi:Periplasmic beta-glucosidase [Hypsibius exemplaris]|uniref:beta-glucosidase n=1 Tax=Hypsibius exemplaris TaxID=2072580 RepID=A0A1W0WP43_HYPEX|nr:Periplasmic beta-glucosidase [Hypsibius exemplaris]